VDADDGYDIATGTIVAWIEFDVNENTDQNIFNIDDRHMVYINNARVKVRWYDGGFNEEYGDVHSIDTWYHVAYDFDADDGTIWVDGVAENENFVKTAVTYATGRGAYLGAQFDEDRDFFSGTMDEVSIFTDRKDSTDINDIMDNGLVQDVETGTTLINVKVL